MEFGVYLFITGNVLTEAFNPCMNNSVERVEKWLSA